MLSRFTQQYSEYFGLFRSIRLFAKSLGDKRYVFMRFVRVFTLIGRGGFLLVILVNITGCQQKPSLQIEETSTTTTTYTDTIYINNCGGKGPSEQTASVTYSSEINWSASGEFSIYAVQAQVDAYYTQYRSVTRSQRVVAPPGTNMVFVLRWTERVFRGNIVSQVARGSYVVYVPVSVEQVESYDMGCGWSGNDDGSDSEKVGYPIYVENNCNKAIEFALAYLNLDNQWVQEKWWHFDAFDGGYLLYDGVKLMSNNSIIYIYAISEDDSVVWEGDTKLDFDGETLWTRKVDLKEPDSDGKWYLSLTCK